MKINLKIFTKITNLAAFPIFNFRLILIFEKYVHMPKCRFWKIKMLQAALQLVGSGENPQGQNSVDMEIYIYYVTPLCGWNQTTLWLEPSVTPSRSLDPKVRSWLGALPCKIRLTVSLTQSHLQTGKNGMSYYYNSDMTHP